MNFARRPRRNTRTYLEHFLRCPLCWGDGGREGPGVGPEQTVHPVPLKVIAYRNLGVRLECPKCGLRFSVPIAGAGGLAEVVGTADEVSLRSGETTFHNAPEVLYSVGLERIDFDADDYPEGVRSLVGRELLDEHRRAIAGRGDAPGSGEPAAGAGAPAGDAAAQDFSPAIDRQQYSVRWSDPGPAAEQAAPSSTAGA